MNEESLNQRIKDWLAVNGYPLEMRVAGACREASFGVVQSEYVLDKSSDKYREIDVLAYRQVGSPSGEIHAALIIECKSDKSKPWILFKNKIGYDARTVIQRTPASIAGKTSLMRSSLDERLQDCFLFKVEERSGYSLVRAFENKDSDSAY